MDYKGEKFLCEGDIDCDWYCGHIVLTFTEEFYCPDLTVWHSAELKPSKRNSFLCNDKTFVAAVIDLLVECDYIKEDPKWKLCCAESDMQDTEYAMFEYLSNGDNKDYLRDLATSLGCVDLNLEDDDE